MTDRFQEINVFVRAAESGSFSATARELGLSQPSVSRIISELEARLAPNGIAFSPDEKYLYVNDTYGKFIQRYRVQADGGVADGERFTDMNADKVPGVPDGMKVDKQGNVYCTGPGGLSVIAPTGKHIGTIKTPEGLTNMNFGGVDGRTLFMTGFRTCTASRSSALSGANRPVPAAPGALVDEGNWSARTMSCAPSASPMRR